MGTIRATWRISLREEREAHMGQTAIVALAPTFAAARASALRLDP
jgi:hypothetical protein